MRLVRFTTANRRHRSTRKTSAVDGRGSRGKRLACERLEERQMLAVAPLPIYATFDQPAWLGLAPPTGGENEPTTVVTPSGGSVAVVASSGGLTDQPVRITDATNANYGSIDFDFEPVSTDSVRAEATVSLSARVDGYFMQIGDGDNAVRLRMTNSGRITDSSFNVLGYYQANTPFRVRVSVTPEEHSWSVVIDNELDGFDNDAPYSGLLYSYSTVSRFSLSLCTVAGSASTSVAFDEVQVSAYSDLVVSNITPLYYDATRSQLQYQYTIKNIGDSPADIEGATSATTDNVIVQGYLSSDNVLDANDVLAGSAVLYGDARGNLEPGKTITGTLDVSAAISGSSHPYVFLVVDSTSVLTESDETNNVGSAVIPDAGKLSILSTFDHETLDTTPATGRLNQPTSTSVTSGSSVTVRVKSNSCGLTGRVLEINNPSSTAAKTGEVTYSFDTLWNGTLRVEATVSFSAVVASTFLVAMDQYGTTALNLQTTAGGLIIDNNSVTLGRYSANTPFRFRIDVDLSSKTWSFIQDTEINGFNDNTAVTSRTFATNITEINRVRAQLYTAANAVALTAAFDNIVIAQPDLVVSNVRALNFTGTYLQYEYTITNVGSDQVNLNGASSGVAADEVQQLAFVTQPASGTYTLTFDLDGIGGSSPAQTTGSLSYSSTAAQIQTALWNLSTIGSGSVLVQGSYTAGFTFTFTRSLGAQNILSSALTADTSSLRSSSGGLVTAQIDTLIEGHAYNTTSDNVTLGVALSTNEVYGDADDLFLSAANLYSANAASDANAIILAPGESYTGRYEISAAIDASAYPYLVFNVGNTAINEVQRVSFTRVPTGGAYTISFDPDGFATAYSAATTASLSYSANAAQVQAALAALSTIGEGNVLVTGSYTAGFNVTFVGDWGARNILDTALKVNTGSLTAATGSVGYTIGITTNGYRVGSAMESNTENNSLGSLIPYAGTFDLTGAVCNVTDAAVWGESISVSFALANAGTGALVADSMQRFYLSTDLVYGNSDDLLLGSAVYTNDVAANGTGAAQSVAFDLPAARSAAALGFASTPTSGTYSISYDADGDGTASLPVTTGSLDYSATAAAVQTALNGLGVFGSNQVRVTGTYVTGFTITFIGRNVSASTLTVNSQLPTGVDDEVIAGSFTAITQFYVLMATDTSGNVFETNESNNLPMSMGLGKDYDAITIVAGPNLRGALLTVPDTLCWGETFTIDYAVQETNGIAVTTDFQQAIYLSADAVFGNSDDVLLGTLTYTANIKGGEVGATLSGTIDMPASKPVGYTNVGTFYIGMYTDSANAVVESDEIDNRPFTNGLGHDASVFALVNVDLRGSLCAVPSTLSWGQPFVVSYQIANDGDDAVTEDFTQTFYLSADAVWDSSDTVLAVVACADNVPAHGTTGTLTRWVRLPDTAPSGLAGTGPYYVLMVTDSGAVVGETNETNNKPTSAATLGADCAAFTIATDLPDLTGAQCYPPTKIEWGTSFVLNYQVANRGSAAVTTDFLQVFFLSADTVFGNSDDVILGGVTVTTDIAAYGRSPLLSANLTLPGGAPAGYTGDGPFYIGMYTEAGGVIWESNETNNQPFTAGLGCDWQFFYIGSGGSTPLTTTSTLGLFDPSTATFSLRNENTSGAADTTFNFGQAGGNWRLLTGDWDGNGTTDVGFYDPATSRFYLSTAYNGSTTYNFGYGVPNAGWIPLVGDWDGDGVDGVGLYDPASSMFFLTNALETGVAQYWFGYGVPHNNWTPLVGDWDGDGAQGVGLYDPHASTFYLTNTLATGYAEYTFGYGQPDGGWEPLVGDWNGDRADGVGLFDGGGSVFYLTDRFVTGYAQYTFGYGVPKGGWDPLIGDWNGDGADGVGLYDGSTSTFYLTNTLLGGYAQYTVEFGTADAGLVPIVGAWVESNTASSTWQSMVSATAVDQVDLARVTDVELESLFASSLDNAAAIDQALAEL
jgi:hypothetical protein